MEDKNIHNKPIVIFGSSSSNGSTRKAIDLVFEGEEVPIIDLNHHNISYFDYEGKNLNDDFIGIAEKMVQHNTIIFASPTYWYTMSAIMKTFLDRWSDLLGHRKDLGRALSGKHMFLITSYSTKKSELFEESFRLTAEYMNMHYGSCFHCNNSRDPNAELLNKKEAELIRDSIFKNKN